MFFFSAKSGAFVVVFFWLSVVCSVLTPRKKKNKTHEKKCFSVCANNIGIFSQLFLFLSAVDSGGAARDTKRPTLIVI